MALTTTHSAVAALAPGQFDTIQVPTGVPGDGEVLIRVENASMIAFDTYVTDRGYMVQDWPAILGFNAAGTVEKVGPNVQNLAVGDRVTTFGYGPSKHKCMQQYTIQPQTTIPDTLSSAEAATIPDNFVTAFYTLFNQLSLPLPSKFPASTAPPRADTPILVYGAGSTAGLYAIQLLHLAGYKKIIATASKKHHEYLRSLGATDTFDYSSPTLVEDIANVVGGDGKVTIAVDCITNETTLNILKDIMSSSGKLAILLPIKEGSSVTNTSHEERMYFEFPPDKKNPLPEGTQLIGVRTFLYAVNDENLKNHLMPDILPQLLRDGYIKPNRVRLLDQGTFKDRVNVGLELLRSNKISGEKADEAYCIGPAPSAQSYLAMDKIIDVCLKSGAQAVHPGYGFLSENAKFSEKLAQNGIVFIGPPASAIVSMGSKSESKNIMLAAGVPCVPGYHGDNQDPDFLFSEAEKIGFPVLIKAIHGGGGKGMRTVLTPTKEAFLEGLESAKRESLKAFGNDTVLVEKYIQTPRHVEVQVFADTMGGVVSLWERDCSVQRRNQKIIEEAPAPGLSPELRADLGAKAVAAAKAVKYVGAGTVEFIFDNDTGKFYFMEMNTRLQVEHPITEMITGQDLVEWQLEVAAGNRLPLTQAAIPMAGHAFEARIYAENPRNNFLPDSGTLAYLSTPTPTHIFAPPLPTRDPALSQTELAALGPSENADAALDIVPSLRIEQGFTQGASIGVFYDPMIAKVVVHGRDRTEALRMLRKALDEYHVVGVSTNVEFLRTLAGNGAFINAEVETGFIPKHFNELFPPLEPPSLITFAKAGLFTVLRDQLSVEAQVSTPWSNLTSRRFGGEVYQRTIQLQTDAGENSTSVSVTHKGNNLYDIVIDGTYTLNSVQARLENADTLVATIDGHHSKTTIVSQKPHPAVPASQSSNTMERLNVFSDGHKTTLVIPSPKWLLSLGGDVVGAKGALKAPMPSLVVEVRVKVGDRVEKGQVVVVIESMKTETALRAHAPGVVRAIACKSGEMVEEGRELVDIETESE
ncbi:hypothetical protein CVT24_005313 [Panaeolus cyanescens]|uniref:Uncharacterized protein n=1 Tax=Panaeolus cyanescens TaxID=181874 RepID=A0A409Y9K0_9AGAR|nr:hypothetical protein CVT24_005313 [Panaeolus cyanescens]